MAIFDNSSVSVLRVITLSNDNDYAQKHFLQYTLLVVAE